MPNILGLQLRADCSLACKANCRLKMCDTLSNITVQVRHWSHYSVKSIDRLNSNQAVTLNYRLSLVEEERMSKEFLSQNVANTQLSLRFSTNTIMKYKEVQVVKVNSYDVLLAYAGCSTTGNGEKLSNSKAEPPQAIKSAVV